MANGSRSGWTLRRSNLRGISVRPASRITCPCSPTRVTTATSYPARRAASASGSLCDTKYQSSVTKKQSRGRFTARSARPETSVRATIGAPSYAVRPDAPASCAPLPPDAGTPPSEAARGRAGPRPTPEAAHATRYRGGSRIPSSDDLPAMRAQLVGSALHMNSRIQLIKARSRGFGNTAHLCNAIYFHLRVLASKSSGPPRLAFCETRSDSPGQIISCSIRSSFAFAAFAQPCHFGSPTWTPRRYTSAGVTESPPVSGTSAPCGRPSL